MNFVVDDLLDFSQLNEGEYRKNISEFDLGEVIKEVISIQKHKAAIKGIRINSRFVPQTVRDNSSPISFFEKLGDERELCNWKVPKDER